MATIIIPAHDEATLIAGTLASLLHQLGPDDEIIVVDNGSSDETAAVASEVGGAVTVLSTPIASKTHAISLGEQHARSWPRIYMDADVELSPGAVDSIKAALVPGRLLAVSPRARMDLSRSSWAVRAYYRIWLSLPYCRRGMIGAGVYALAEAGRSRFDRFPSLIADDGYVRAQFREEERGSVDHAFATVRAPANFFWLLKIKVRSRLGQMQLARECPHLLGNERKEYGRTLWRLFINPLNWPASVVYLTVVSLSRLKAQSQLSSLGQYRWEKDQSSRNVLPEHRA